jgi:transposase
MKSVLQVLSCFLGIDVSKATLVVCLAYADSEQCRTAEFPNTEAGCAALLGWLGKDAAGCRVVMEATSRYHRLCEQTLMAKCSMVELLNPRRARALADGLGFLDKDDKVDAQALSKAARLLERQGLCVPALATQELRDLSRSIDQMKEDAGKYLKRLEGLEPDSPAYQSNLETANMLKARAKAQEKVWNELAAKDPETFRRYRLAKSVPSVGQATARAVSVELPANLDKVSVRKIFGYAGLAPRRHQSGGMEMPPAIYGGNARLRTALFMAARHSVFHGKRHLSFYETLKNRKHVNVRTQGGRHLKAITAVMRKLLGNIVAVIKRNEPWQEKPPESSHVPACEPATIDKF